MSRNSEVSTKKVYFELKNSWKWVLNSSGNVSTMEIRTLFSSLLVGGLVTICGCEKAEPGPAVTGAPESNIESGSFKRDDDAKRISGFEVISPDAVVAQFKKDGLECGRTSDAKSDGQGSMTPDVATQGVRFLLPSLGEDSGGRIWSFSNADDQELLRAHYAKMADMGAAFRSHLIVYKNILVQINGDLPSAKAKAYEKSLGKL